jgi:HK97 family phage major capsid protein
LIAQFNERETMKSIQALREQKAALAKEARNMIEQKGDRKWTKDEQTAFDAKADQMEDLDRDITNMQRVLDQEAENRFDDVDQFRRDPTQNKKDSAVRQAYGKLLREGAQALTREEHVMIRDTMSTTTPSQGGYAVQSEVAKELIESLKSYGGMREVASQIATAQGNPLSYPTSDGTAEEGEWVPENTSATDADPSFGTVALNAFKASSKVITVPIELLTDSTIDIVAMLNARVRTRIGRTMNKGFTIGGGSGEPMGFVPAASVGKTGATGQVATILYDDLIDVQESVDEAYLQEGDCNWMMHQNMRKVVRKLKDSNGRPIWADSYEAGIKTGTPAQLLGNDVVINNHMAAPAANAKSLGYGCFDRYMIRDVLALTLFRFDDSAYMKKGQVGFLAWARAGGNLLDAAAIKLYQHPAT